MSSSSYNEVVFVSPLSPSNDDNINDNDRTALIILNTFISSNPLERPVLERLWALAEYKICADGGANRLWGATSKDNNSTKYIPHCIRGDLDSLLPHVRGYYSQRGVDVELDPDQNTNDLDKALQKLQSYDKFQRIIVYGAFGGRFDQEMASFQALYKWGEQCCHRLWLYSEETCAVLLPTTTTTAGMAPSTITIHLPYFDETVPAKQMMGEGPTCGLIPLGGACETIRTSGLKWDLDGSIPLAFGGLVSTSNRVMKARIQILELSHPVVFTAEITRLAVDVNEELEGGP